MCHEPGAHFLQQAVGLADTFQCHRVGDGYAAVIAHISRCSKTFKHGNALGREADGLRQRLDKKLMVGRIS
jgi:hypothetical protein